MADPFAHEDHADFGWIPGRQRGRVYTGSHNYAISSLRLADETLLRVTNESVHSAFLHNFYVIRDTCAAHA